MAVAEKALAQEKLSGNPYHQLAVGSLLGALYVFFSLGMIFTGIPTLWAELVPLKNEFLSGALLILVEMLAIVGFLLLGLHLEKGHALRGLRAGIFVSVVFFLFLALVGRLVGGGLEELGAFGAILTLAVLGGVAFAASRLFLRPRFADWLGELEDGGWFHATSYKANQGVRVRRGTVVALLTLGIAGIITLVTHRALGSELRYDSTVIANNWEVHVPFWKEFFGEEGYSYSVPVLFKVHYTLPLILLAGLVWLSWRVVNWPVFADFLIATEAEMNKVSWTTRRRLVQDTIVVLVTVIMLTMFLFFIDILWIRLLSWDVIRVLQIDPKEVMQKQQEKTQW
jgi:preprotein translocase SecE subunit